MSLLPSHRSCVDAQYSCLVSAESHFAWKAWPWMAALNLHNDRARRSICAAGGNSCADCNPAAEAETGIKLVPFRAIVSTPGTERGRTAETMWSFGRPCQADLRRLTLSGMNCQAFGSRTEQPSLSAGLPASPVLQRERARYPHRWEASCCQAKRPLYAARDQAPPPSPHCPRKPFPFNPSHANAFCFCIPIDLWNDPGVCTSPTTTHYRNSTNDQAMGVHTTTKNSRKLPNRIGAPDLDHGRSHCLCSVTSPADAGSPRSGLMPRQRRPPHRAVQGRKSSGPSRWLRTPARSPGPQRPSAW